MRIGNLAGRLVIVSSEVRSMSSRPARPFGSDPQAIYDRWDEFRQWSSHVSPSTATAYNPADLGAPVPRPASSSPSG